jgi:hypothetical protein
MSDNGKDPRNLTHHPDAEDIDPAVSSTGRVAFASDRHRNNFEIFAMNLDGSVMRRLTPVPGNQRFQNIQPAWSPDGNWIAFVSTRDGNEEIYIMNASPEGPTNVPRRLTFDRDQSDDGRAQAFAACAPGSGGAAVAAVTESDRGLQGLPRKTPRHSFYPTRSHRDIPSPSNEARSDVMQISTHSNGEHFTGRAIRPGKKRPR